MKLLPWLVMAILAAVALLLLGSAIFPGFVFSCPEQTLRLPEHCVNLERDPVKHDWIPAEKEFNCLEVR